MQILGIDLGTSYIKGAILDLDSRTIHHVTRQPFPGPLPQLPIHHHEVDPQAVIQATRALLAGLLPLAPQCGTILISSQMHGFLLTDARGTPITPCITWLDQRALGTDAKTGQTYLETLQSLLRPEDILTMGNGFKSGLPLCALYTLARTRIPDQASRPVLWSISDYVFCRLAHDGPFDAGQHSTMEPTIAASMGVYNFASGGWHRDVLGRLELDTLHMPQIVGFDHPSASIRLDDKEITIYPALGDHQSATLGSLVAPGELALNISTGSQASLAVPEWTPSDNYESRPYFGGRNLNTVTRVPAGRALADLVNLLTEIPRRQGIEHVEPWDAVIQAIAEAELATADDETLPHLAVNLSFFGGAFGASGSIQNMTEANMTVGHLFLAAFESMAANYARCAEWLGWTLPPEARRIVFAGGLAQRFPALRAAICRHLEADSRLSPHPEDTLLGLLALGMVIHGHSADLDSAVEQLNHDAAQKQEAGSSTK